MGQYFLRTAFLVGALACTTACTNWDFSKRVIRQGNLNINKNVERLRLGMTKSQVATVMGNSLVSPLFRQDRWDYASTEQIPRQKMQVQSVSLFFDNDRLVKIAHS